MQSGGPREGTDTRNDAQAPLMPGVTGARWEFARRDPILAEGAVRFLDEHDRGRRKSGPRRRGA
jgi:hypothetical protein